MDRIAAVDKGGEHAPRYGRIRWFVERSSFAIVVIKGSWVEKGVVERVDRPEWPFWLGEVCWQSASWQRCANALSR